MLAAFLAVWACLCGICFQAAYLGLINMKADAWQSVVFGLAPLAAGLTVALGVAVNSLVTLRDHLGVALVRTDVQCHPRGRYPRAVLPLDLLFALGLTLSLSLARASGVPGGPLGVALLLLGTGLVWWWLLRAPLAMLAELAEGRGASTLVGLLLGCLAALIAAGTNWAAGVLELETGHARFLLPVLALLPWLGLVMGYSRRSDPVSAARRAYLGPRLALLTPLSLLALGVALFAAVRVFYLPIEQPLVVEDIMRTSEIRLSAGAGPDNGWLEVERILASSTSPTGPFPDPELLPALQRGMAAPRFQPRLPESAPARTTALDVWGTDVVRVSNYLDWESTRRDWREVTVQGNGIPDPREGHTSRPDLEDRVLDAALANLTFTHLVAGKGRIETERVALDLQRRAVKRLETLLLERSLTSEQCRTVVALIESLPDPGVSLVRACDNEFALQAACTPLDPPARLRLAACANVYTRVRPWLLRLEVPPADDSEHLIQNPFQAGILDSLPDYAGLVRAKKSVRDHLQGAELLAALELYRLKRGAYPGHLGALKGVCLARVPGGWLLGGSFVWSKRKDGPSYVLDRGSGR